MPSHCDDGSPPNRNNTTPYHGGIHRLTVSVLEKRKEKRRPGARGRKKRRENIEHTKHSSNTSEQDVLPERNIKRRKDNETPRRRAQDSLKYKRPSRATSSNDTSPFTWKPRRTTHGTFVPCDKQTRFKRTKQKKQKRQRTGVTNKRPVASCPFFSKQTERRITVHTFPETPTGMYVRTFTSTAPGSSGAFVTKSSRRINFSTPTNQLPTLRQASSNLEMISHGLARYLPEKRLSNHTTNINLRRFLLPSQSQWNVCDMRVVEGLERQKSTRDMLAGAGGEPASRPIPPVLESTSKQLQRATNKISVTFVPTRGAKVTNKSNTEYLFTVKAWRSGSNLTFPHIHPTRAPNTHLFGPSEDRTASSADAAIAAASVSLLAAAEAELLEPPVAAAVLLFSGELLSLSYRIARRFTTGVTAAPPPPTRPSRALYPPLTPLEPSSGLEPEAKKPSTSPPLLREFGVVASSASLRFGRNECSLSLTPAADGQADETGLRGMGGGGR